MRANAPVIDFFTWQNFGKTVIFFLGRFAIGFQEIAAKNFYRPRNADVAAKYKQQFPEIKLFTVDELFGGWKKAQPTHFNDGGLFDKIYKPAAK